MSTPLIIREKEAIIDGRRVDIRSDILLERISTSCNVDVLPPHTVWVSPKRKSILVQRPPEYRNVSIRDDGAPECYCYDGECGICTGEYDDYIQAHHANAEGWGTYRLPLPWVTYVFDVNQYQVTLYRIFASCTPIEDTNQLLGFLILPNVYEGGGLCAGNVGLGISRNTLSVAEATGEAMENFWGSAFNADVTNYLDSLVYSNLGLRGANDYEETIDNPFKVWERLDLEEVLQLPWEKDTGHKVDDEIKDLLLKERSTLQGRFESRALLSTMKQCCLLSRF